MKKIIISLLTILSVALTYKGFTQNYNNADNRTTHSIETTSNFDSLFYPLFGSPPRAPLANSFYNKSMWNYDWYRKIGYTKDELSLLGTNQKIKTYGKTVIYDASMNFIPKTVNDGGGDKIIINPTYITVVGDSKSPNFFIPIEYIGDKSILSSSLSRREKEEIAIYLKKAIDISGVTPSSVVINARNNDFNIFIYKSEFTNEEPIIRTFFVRSRINELIKEATLTRIESYIDNAQLSDAIAEIEVLKKQFPSLERKLNNVLKKIDYIHESANVNKDYNDKIQSYYIEEHSDYFYVYDGINPKQKFNIDEKDAFTEYLMKQAEADTDVIYFNFGDQHSNKSSAFVNSLAIQGGMRAETLSGKVDNRTLLFYGKIIDKEDDIEQNESGYKQRYVFKVGNKKVTADVGVQPVEGKMSKKNKRKLPKTFFGILNSLIGKGLSTCNSINISRKKTNEVLDTKDDEYKTWLKERRGKDVDFVFIEIIKVEEISEDE